MILENYLEPYVFKNDMQRIKKPAIDLKLGMERIGVYSKEKAMHALELLMTSLPQDLALLNNAKAKRDRMSMDQILHKLSGALNYSSAPALEKAVQDLQGILKTDDPSAISKGIQAIQEQTKLLKAAYYDLLMDDA